MEGALSRCFSSEQSGGSGKKGSGRKSTAAIARALKSQCEEVAREQSEQHAARMVGEMDGGWLPAQPYLGDKAGWVPRVRVLCRP